LASVEKYPERQLQAVAKWRSSGLTQAEFCRREGLKEWQLSNWKRLEFKNNPGEAKRKPLKKRGAGAVRQRRPAGENEDFWRAHVLAHAKSGLRRGEYCKQHGLSINSYKRWRAKFLEELKSNARSAWQQVANPFVEVHVPPSVPPTISNEETIELVLPGGVKIVVTERTPLDLLAKVLKTAQELTC
jgi:hypothetical protein